MDQACRFEFRPYRRPFKRPLQTHHGLWEVREGLILRLTDAAGRTGWGEIAPIETFGSESLEQALKFCQALPAEMPLDLPLRVPSALPACQFGFESAWEGLTQSEQGDRSLQSCAYSILLPTGAAALETCRSLRLAGTCTLKWKIGVASVAQELKEFERLLDALPAGTCLRLDANGGLTWDDACQWLQKCDRLASSKQHQHKVEFLEQPLPPHQLKQMLKLSDRYTTPIALDESVATLEQLKACYRQGWRGIFVIKAAIAGSPRQLREFCRAHELDVVWSSVFETAIARHFIEAILIPSLPASSRAIGFGIDHWFTDAALSQPNFQQLWQSL